MESMAISLKRQHNTVRNNFVRACKLHIVIGLLFAAQIMAYDAGKLITPELVLKRWFVTSVLVIVAAMCWYIAKLSDTPKAIHRLAWILIAADLAVASFYVYTTRGMASRAVILFVIPILVAAIIARKGMIYLTAAAAIATYTVTAIAYFVLNFNEGYKLELYGEISFYSAILLVIAGLSWIAVRTKH